VKKARCILPVVLVVLGILVPAGSSNADENIWGRCPDGYVPLPPFDIEQDRNGNGIVCVKFVGHVNVIDDPTGGPYSCNGFPVPPPECMPDPVGASAPGGTVD
ncbi:MAG TPA: hypothetical protein VF715_10665, partial [Thermoleophilaceae bacterium]|jgi:hypothetical protein